MEFELCLALGVDHPDQLHERLTPRQLLEWQVYYRLYPWGGYRDDYRQALTTMAASHGKIDFRQAMWQPPLTAEMQALLEDAEADAQSARLKRLAEATQSGDVNFDE